MNLLDNNLFKQKLTNHKCFDLKKNNAKFGAIIELTTNPIETMKSLFHKILVNDQLENGFYELRNLFTNVEMYDSQMVINCLIDCFTKKLTSIKQTIFTEPDEKRLEMFKLRIRYH